jgi:hypothetical protein
MLVHRGFYPVADVTPSVDPPASRQSGRRPNGARRHSNCHPLRCALSPLGPRKGGCAVRTIQELLGRNDVETTMICTHVLNRDGRGVRSLVNSTDAREWIYPKGFCLASCQI